MIADTSIRVSLIALGRIKMSDAMRKPKSPMTTIAYLSSADFSILLNSFSFASRADRLNPLSRYF